MKASELVTILVQRIAAHGDIDVKVSAPNKVDDIVEISDGDGWFLYLRTFPVDQRGGDGS